MAFEHEQELISEFIRNFDPGEFSSAEDLVFDKNTEEKTNGGVIQQGPGK